jgi:hypothetical protein
MKTDSNNDCDGEHSRLSNFVSTEDNKTEREPEIFCVDIATGSVVLLDPM